MSSTVLKICQNKELSTFAVADQQKSTMSKSTSTNIPSYTFRLSDCLSEIRSDWEQAAPENIFLNYTYLNSLEQYPPKGMRFGYVVFYKNETPIGVAYLQIKYFKADENIGELTENQALEQKKCFFTAFSNFIKRKVASKVASDVLVLGNLLLTGEHAFHFDYSQISEQNALELLEKACVAALPELKANNVSMPVVFVKDVPPNKELALQKWSQEAFARFAIQPNMVLDNRWQNFAEYLASMTTKYRTRAKRAKKKLGKITKRALSLEELQQHKEVMYEQYYSIASSAVFNMVELHEDYFYGIKKMMPDHFEVYGYFDGEQFLGYFTTFSNCNELEAHFLGYDKEQNRERQIYQNMLYDLVEKAIESKAERLVLGRTALEIKSTVGAEPVAMDCFLRHQNKLANRFTPTMLDYLNPVEEWTQRHPFKEEE